jgi:hypothetical protein
MYITDNLLRYGALSELVQWTNQVPAHRLSCQRGMIRVKL